MASTVPAASRTASSARRFAWTSDTTRIRMSGERSSGEGAARPSPSLPATLRGRAREAPRSGPGLADDQQAVVGQARYVQRDVSDLGAPQVDQRTTACLDLGSDLAAFP